MAAMKKVMLGGKVEVTQCCLGTMTWGSQNSEAEAHAQLDYFVANGGTFIDTAELYPVPPQEEYTGSTEKFIGTWIKANPEKRAGIFLASKIAGPRDITWVNAARNPEDPKPRPPALSAEQIPEALEGSLRRLQTDYLDLYQLHWPERYVPLFGTTIFDPAAGGGHQLFKEKADHASVEEQVEAMGKLIKAGKIRHWGLSNETSYGVMLFCQTADKLGVPRPVSIQNDFSLVDRRFEMELAETCHHLKVSLLAYGPLAGGYLSGKYMPAYENSSVAASSRAPDDSRHRKYPKFQPRYAGAASAVAAERYCEIAKGKGLAPATLALAWCASRLYIKDSGCVIIGATTLPQLEENVKALSVELDEATLKDIDRVHRANPHPNCDQSLLN